MKPLFLAILSASLVLNAALAYAALTGRSRLAASASESPPSTLHSPLSTPSGPAPVDPATWKKLETTDHAALVTHLRAAGFPPEVIRAILRAQIHESFAGRHRALDPAAADRAFWKDPFPDPELQRARSKLYLEEQSALRAALGADARNPDPAALVYLRSRFGALPTATLDAAQLIAEEFNRKSSELYLQKGSLTPAERAQLDREQRAALAGILTPAQLEEYDFRTSNTGRSLRSELATFNPTEAEFRAIFQLRQPFDEKYSSRDGPLGQEAMRQRSDAQKQLTEQIKALLGPDRSADYERSIDYNFRQTSQLVARLELPPATAVALFNLQKEFEQRSSALYRTASTAPVADRNQQLAALHQEALAKITPLLGTASGVEAYQQYGGYWLENLAPCPTPPR